MKSKKNKLSLERKYELEKGIALGDINVDSLSNLELSYVKGAIRRPYLAFKKFIYLYDKSSPKFDELLFVEFLAGTYDSNTEEVINRIKEVRGISRIETNAEVEKLRSELKAVERRINIDIKNDGNKK